MSKKILVKNLCYSNLEFFLLISVALGMTSSNMFYLKEITEAIFMDTSSPVQAINITNTTFTDLNTWIPQEKTLRQSVTIADFWRVRR